MTRIAGDKHAITLTPDHMVFVSKHALRAPWATPAEHVEPGDFFWVHDDGGKLVAEQVRTVSLVLAHGAFAPFTLEGTIIADSVLASVFTGGMHDGRQALYALHRAYLRLWPDAVGRLPGDEWMAFSKYLSVPIFSTLAYVVSFEGLF
jgi:hypothetical protein